MFAGGSDASHVANGTVTVDELARAGQWEVALRLFDDARGSRVEPGEAACHAALGACGRATAWSQALWLLREMNGARCQTNGVTYSAAVAACATCGQWAEVLRLLDEVPDEQAPLRSPAPDARRPSNLAAVAWGALAVPQVSSHDALTNTESYLSDLTQAWRRALELTSWGPQRNLDDALSRRPWTDEERAALGASDLLQLSDAVDLGRAGNWEQAMHMLNAMQKASPSDDGLLPTGNTWQGSLQHLDDSIQIMRNMYEASGAAPATADAIKGEAALIDSAFDAVVSCAKGGQCARAMAVLHDLRSSEASASARTDQN